MQHSKTFQNSAFQLFYKEGTAFLCTQCVLMSKHNFCLFTRKVQWTDRVSALLYHWYHTHFWHCEHINCCVLWRQRGIRQNRPTVEAVCVPACWDTSSSSALFVFGLKLQQYLRPRPGVSLLSWVRRDVHSPYSSAVLEEPWKKGGPGSGVWSLQWCFCSPLHYPYQPCHDTQPLRSSGTQCEG